MDGLFKTDWVEGSITGFFFQTEICVLSRQLEKGGGDQLELRLASSLKIFSTAATFWSIAFLSLQ